MQKLGVFIISIVLVSCSANWHIKKAISKDPSILNRDTVTVIDTAYAYSERVEVDSIFKLSSDTTVILKENLKITHYYHNDSIFITGECDSQLVYVPFEVQVPYEQIVYKEKEDMGKIWLWVIIAALAAFILGILLVLRYRK